VYASVVQHVHDTLERRGTSNLQQVASGERVQLCPEVLGEHPRGA
jgi:hypothetical protein